MTDLIDSLRELAHQRSAISPEPTDLEQIIRRAIESGEGATGVSHRQSLCTRTAKLEGMFRSAQTRAAFFNLILNACESYSWTARAG